MTITDPKGSENELSDYYCVKSGMFAFDFTPALNDEKGRWKISVLDLTSGLKAEKTFELVE